MKILTILGTRPEIIRLSRVIPLLDSCCDHVIVHTGQNYDRNLNEVFFDDLGVTRPHHNLGASGTYAEQIAKISTGLDEVIDLEKPDKFLVLGDTNSSLGAIVARRRRIPVCHMEAGNRCFDLNVPEEVNRRIIDSCTDVHLPYSERSRMNLLRDGYHPNSIYVTGNPMTEVIEHYHDRILGSDIMQRLRLSDGEFIISTIHRAENTDSGQVLSKVMASLAVIAEKIVPVVLSVHPRLKKVMEQFSITLPDGVRGCEPFGFFEFQRLMMGAALAVSDSGTVQEECAIYEKPNLIFRRSTERQEVLEVGGSLLCGSDPDDVESLIDSGLITKTNTSIPPEYSVKDVSVRVAKVLMSTLDLKRD